MIEAAANIAKALKQREKNGSISLVVGEANSLGLALFGGDSVEAALERLTSGQADAVVVLENDLYRRTDAARVDAALAAAKVTVAITAGLSGAVLLSSINSQLGNVGYVIAVEYGFYVFFALCLVCIITALVGEKTRLEGRSTALVDRTGRALFALGFAGTITAACIAFVLWR